MRNQALISFLLISIAVLSSCENSETASKGNYYPTTKGSRWTYEVKGTCDWPNQTSTCVTTREALADGEDLPWDDSYDPFQSATSPNQFIKVKGHEYFGYGYYLPEYKFLDDALPLGSKWTAYEEEDPIIKEEFEIMEVNASKTIYGKKYHDVIVVKSTLLFKTSDKPQPFEVAQTITRYYARGIGEIYAFVDRDFEGQVEQTEYSLTNYFIAN